MNLKARVDPELVPSLDDTIGALGFDFMGTLDAPQRRARFDEFLHQVLPVTRAVPEVHRLDQKIPGYGGGPEVSVRAYRPPKQPPQSAGVLFIHGGGFNIGSVEQEDASAAALALNLRCTLVSVDYRLGPEHPHPAPVHDCYAALKWMAAHAADLGVDRKRIAVYGHSAGGGLAATLAQMARDQRGPGIAYQMLCYPMLDDRMDSPAFSRLSGIGVWDLGANATAWRALLGGDRERVSSAAPYAVAARATDLAALPAAYIDVGDLDILLDQAIDYGRRLMDAGVAVELHVYPGAYHGFDAFAPHASVSQRAIQSRLTSLRRALSLAAE